MPTSRKSALRRKLRVAFVDGAPSAAYLHLPGLLARDDISIVAVSTLDGLKSRIPEHADVKDYGPDYERMIEETSPDAVYVIAAPARRYDVAVTVLDRGCNLFINKPPAVTSEQIRQLHLLAEKRSVLTGVVFYRRFSPIVRTGKARCESYGPIHSAVATFYKNSLGRPAYDRGAIDALTSDAIHAVDTLRYLCGGAVASVASRVRRLEVDWTNAHEALVTFDSGAVGVILTNFAAGRRMFTVEVHAPGISCFGDLEEGGQIFADGNVEATESFSPFGEHDPGFYRGFGIAEINLPKASWHTDVNAHFLDCIRKGRQPETHFGDALKTMELVDAIYASQI